MSPVDIIHAAAATYLCRRSNPSLLIISFSIVNSESVLAISSEVEGIQGSCPQILFGGGWLPKITYHGDNPPIAHPLRAVSPPPIK